MSKLLNQYNELKKQDASSIYLFRVGIFYNILNEDAKIINEKLGLKITDLGPCIFKCGFPVSQLDKYIILLNKLQGVNAQKSHCFQFVQTLPDNWYSRRDDLHLDDGEDLAQKIGRIGVCVGLAVDRKGNEFVMVGVDRGAVLMKGIGDHRHVTRQSFPFDNFCGIFHILIGIVRFVLDVYPFGIDTHIDKTIVDNACLAYRLVGALSAGSNADGVFVCDKVFVCAVDSLTKRF